MNIQELNPQRLKPRNGHVILYRELVEERNGLLVPQNSAEAWKWTVVAIADEVTDLCVGDSVWVSGKIYENYAPIPNTKDLYIIDARCIMIVIGADSNPEEKCDGNSVSDR